MTMGKWWQWSLGSILALVLCMPAVAEVHAGDPLDTVREANQHYDSGRFAEALRLYRVAYDGLDDGRLLYRIGLSYENLGNYQRAREFLERYLQADPDSPVKGRVEANIAQLTALEDNIQSFLVVETEPAGAEIYLYGYMGASEGSAPVTVPVGAGTNQVTLVFPQGQRLEVNVDVPAGTKEERFFSVGTATRPTESEEVASIEDGPVEPAEERPVVEPTEEPEEDGDEPDERVAEVEDDVIPMPGSEPEERRRIQLDNVDIGPPGWAQTLAVIGIAGGNLLLLSALIDAGNFEGRDGDPIETYGGPGAVFLGLVGVGGGYYLLRRGWHNRLPSISATRSDGSGSAAAGSSFMLQWSTEF